MRALSEWVGDAYVDLSQPSSEMALQLENIHLQILTKAKVIWKDSLSYPLHMFMLDNTPE